MTTEAKREIRDEVSVEVQEEPRAPICIEERCNKSAYLQSAKNAPLRHIINIT